jgi:hypothetical protein
MWNQSTGGAWMAAADRLVVVFLLLLRHLRRSKIQCG